MWKFNSHLIDYICDVIYRQTLWLIVGKRVEINLLETTKMKPKKVASLETIKNKFL